MKKLVHDKRPFYNRRIIPLDDPEWAEAEQADERAQYYWCEDLSPGRRYGKFVRRFKPSVASLVITRTGWKLTPIKGTDDGRQEGEKDEKI